MSGNPNIEQALVRPKWGIIGAISGAILASVCCIGPLVLLTLGVSGAWISNLTLLAPYRPYIIVVTLAFLGFGFFAVYRKPKADQCETGSYCANPKSDKVNKIALWAATVIVVGLIGFTYLAPYLLG